MAAHQYPGHRIIDREIEVTPRKGLPTPVTSSKSVSYMRTAHRSGRPRPFKPLVPTRISQAPNRLRYRKDLIAVYH